jgi:nucleoside phosphorylase
MPHSNDYTVGYICSIETEYLAAVASLEEQHDGLDFISPHDTNNYTLGKIGKHNIVIAISPKRDWGLATTAIIATHMQRSFPTVTMILILSIAGGAPSERQDIRLGDIVVSSSRGSQGAVFQYDFVENAQDREFEPRGISMEPPAILQMAVNKLKDHYRAGHQLGETINGILERHPTMLREYSRPPLDSDVLHGSSYTNKDAENFGFAAYNDSSYVVPREPRTGYELSPKVHYGLVASGNQVIRDAVFRDRLAMQKNVLCFDAGAAGIMYNFPCLVICGIHSYSDTHATSEWNGYAAMAAAAYAKDLICKIPSRNDEAESKVNGIPFDQAVTKESKSEQRPLENECLVLTDSIEADQPRDYKDYTVGVICAIEFEMSAVRYMLDREHKRLKRQRGESIMYILGELEGHNVALACLPGSQGKGAAANVANDMRRTFPSIELRLMVGIGGGVPSPKNDIHLGDVVVSMPEGQYGGVVQYDLGKNTDDGFVLKGYLSPPPEILRSAVVIMRSDLRLSQSRVPEFLAAMAEKSHLIREHYQRPSADADELFDAEYQHDPKHDTCVECDKTKLVPRPTRGLVPKIHYGLIASGDQVIRSAKNAAEIGKRVVGDILCFEMEAAGILTELPCIVIRGISDYADSHKNDAWQHYAAGAAAGCAKELLSYLDPK